MISNNGWKIHYQPVTDVLSGSYTAYDLGQLSTPYSCTGRKDYIDQICYDANELDATPTWDLYTDKDFDKSDKGFEDWKKTFTPYMDVARRRIAVTSKLIEAGTSFKHNEEDMMMAGANPESDVARKIIASFKKKENSMFLSALNCTSINVSEVTKVGNDYEDKESTKSFAELGGLSYAVSNTEGAITIDDLAEMQAMTAKNMTDNEQWFVLVSPTQKAKMIQANIDYVFSKDFVSMGGSLENGTLPKIMDFVVIAHPDMEASAYANKFFCFTKSAIAKAVFSDLQFNVGEDPSRRFQKILYYSKNIDFKCKDCGKLIQGTITTTGA